MRLLLRSCSNELEKGTQARRDIHEESSELSTLFVDI
ncbi:unnamed protein product, partial [Didymodactylos carnosus]